MGRRPDPRIRRLRERARQLELEGLKTSQICERPEFEGVDIRTVQRWLRDVRGKKREEPARVEYERLKREGLTRPEIADRIGISEAYSWSLDHEFDGPKIVSSKDRLPIFFADPKECRAKDWALTESFALALNFHVKTLVNDHPAAVETEERARHACEHFAALAEIRHGKAKRRATCDLVQALANEAARLRALDDPEGALAVLAEARTIANGCRACAAELDRRAALTLRDLERFDEALNGVFQARAFYETGDAGHDPDGNGMGNCGLAEANIHSRMGAYDLATRAAKTALRHVEEGSLLSRYLLASICFYAVRSGDTSEARRIYDEKRFPDPSRARIQVRCHLARIEEADGHLEKAVDILEDTLADVEDVLKDPPAAAYILGELGRLEGGDGDALALRIEDLGEAEDDGPNRPPKWTEPLWLVGAAAELFDRARRLARAGSAEQALALLRAEGTSFLPAIT